MNIYKKLLLLSLLTGFFSVHLVLAQNLDSVGGDRQALVDLYKATNGDKWKNNSGWLKGNPSNKWYGVEVDKNGRVVKIKLNGSDFGKPGESGGNGLSGRLPASIGNLTKVTYFNVKQNNISGEIPSSVGNMVRLTHLLLNGLEKDMERDQAYHPGKPTGYNQGGQSNNFSGAIPTSIGNLVRLKWFELLGGTKGQITHIPSSIGNLKNLEGLQLSFNRINRLPSSMGNLTELRHLTFRTQKNEMKGQDVMWLSRLTKLQYLFIQDNEMGTKHPDLRTLSDLRVYTGNSNSFTGSVPAYLIDGSMPHINMIQLAWNNLDGSFPEIKEPNNLTAFTVEGNNITGEIPSSWGTSAARHIINFGVGWNNLEGEFPDMSHAYQLRYIRATDNNFTGKLPRLHKNNSSLTNLWFGNNKFSGKLDASIVEAIINGRKSFGDFDLSGNRFCKEDLAGIVKAMNGLNKEVNFRYGGQNDPICGGDEEDKSSDKDDKEFLADAPVPLSPINEGNGVTLNPTFEWSDTGADYYILNYRRSNPTGPTIEAKVNETSFAVIEKLAPESTYIWRVRGMKDDEEGEWSNIFYFKTKKANAESSDGFVVEAPELLAPADKGDVNSQQLSFEWSSVEADYYILHITRENDWGRQEGFFLSDEEGIFIEDTTYTVPAHTLPNRTHAWSVAGVKNGVTGEWSRVRRFKSKSGNPILSGNESDRPVETGIDQNYPNPFNPSTQIQFSLSELQNVSLRVYDMAGRQVAVLVDGVKQAGNHTATFSADHLASGVYFYRLITENKTFTKKMTLVK